MINIKLDLPSPVTGFSFRNYVSKNVKITSTRSLELQFYRCGAYLIDLDMSLCFTGFDHAGPHFDLGILGFYISVGLPDCRHWDTVNNRWE